MGCHSVGVSRAARWRLGWERKEWRQGCQGLLVARMEGEMAGADKKCAMDQNAGDWEGRGNRGRSTFVVNDAHICRAAGEESRRS
jgi:hypothetical protein